jgi:hypothetical protein
MRSDVAGGRPGAVAATPRPEKIAWKSPQKTAEIARFERVVRASREIKLNSSENCISGVA